MHSPLLSRRTLQRFVALAVGTAATTAALSSRAEPTECLSQNPAEWPVSAKPYFMLAVDTSGSMTACTTPPTQYGTECNAGAVGYKLNSCGMVPNRLNDAKCALRKTVQAFAGEVNFGMATFASYLSGCPAGACVSQCGSPNGGVCNSDYYTNCSWNVFPNTSGACGNSPACSTGAGPGAPLFAEGTWNNGANLVVPLAQDPWWNPAATPGSNVPELLKWFDGNCDESKELFAAGSTPIAGVLQGVATYLRAGWKRWTTSDYCPAPTYTYATPLDTNDRACRSVNVILLTDGDESCNGDHVAAARNLYDVNAVLDGVAGGVTIGGKTWKVPVYVINFAGGTTSSTDAIAAAGGTTASHLANNEVELAQAMASIISKSVSPEKCDNTDNNCNGCTDEGYLHYCNRSQTCCAWTTTAQRTTCLTNYQATITAANPQGDLTKLPCTTAAQQANPASWLCYNPGELCDDVDNNCQSGVDEGVLKCGNPLHCPTTETCNGQDDDCDGTTDENVCSGCVPSAEICDGCDNDCDGMVDDGAPSAPCGLSAPANCIGTMTCKAAQPVATPGACIAGGGYNVCGNSPQTEVCDGIDNDCDGTADDGLAAVSCVPAGTPAGLVYGGSSQCKMGSKPCNGACTGFVGPSAEVCDGIDNDCDGQVDDQAFGVGQSCGLNQAPCTPGTTVCVNGALVCQGGTSPQAEVCDGIDNNCNGSIDEAPLADGPGAGQNGCWRNAGNCCSFHGVTWCPPAGATCNAVGSLTAPCSTGTLACSAGAWSCQGGNPPSAETCDNIDNDCDGKLDDIAGLGGPCGTSTGECTAGTLQCTNGLQACLGSVGPSTEVCDGLDNDCDGETDEGIGGLGAPCGNSTTPCSPGVTACVGGQIVCQGGVLPQDETCDGVDNNCDGSIDNAPLADAPPPGQHGCWTTPGDCCSFAGVAWCPPPGATCNGAGTLTPPCSAGTLTCGGSSGWSCKGAAGPGEEVCDGLDNNCDGASDNVAVVECVPAGTPAGLQYGGKSQCKMGTKSCGACAGFVGPSVEICDGIDNDCNGEVDDGATGVGSDCGFNVLPCTVGKTACVNGVLVCSGGLQPQPELCDGIDNNCNGSVDETPLADAPGAGQNGCWPEAGDCCTFKNLSWCPPAGAECHGPGTLPPPCSQGFLSCNGAAGWACMNPKVPTSEVCDGIDNDCDSQVDDGNLPNTGNVCGSDEGECQTGTLACNAGVLTCAGAIGPAEEVCDGKDNNCNGSTDEGIATGGSCTVVYDTNAYPGLRNQGACKPGVAECDGNGGLKCSGGIGPQPEVCDGIDNDCDGQTDEPGAAPDGLDGTDNPLAPPQARIGDACGQDTGSCDPGTWRCLNGIFACIGGTGPTYEQCDCADNDCDGVSDEDNEDGGPPLCGAGKTCVKTGAGSCQCAAICGSGEFKCPAGQSCEEVHKSSTNEPLPNYYCIQSVDLCQGDCATKTAKGPDGKVACAPLGTDPAGCVNTPVCACNKALGCVPSCTNVQCSAGAVCSNFGPTPGTCVADNCFMTGCQGCNKACHLGSCVDNPCKAGTCPAGKVCKPKDNFTGHDCVGSCAGVTCPGGKTCVDGACVDGCSALCASGTVCDPATKSCVPDKCTSEGGASPCTDGSCCNPVTGACGDCPCEGVVCPSGQSCQDGQCKSGAGGSGGTGGSAGASGSAGKDGGIPPDGGGGTGAKPDSGTTPEQGESKAVTGLATGGGGCMCGTTASGHGSTARLGLAILAALGLIMGRRSRAGRRWWS